MTLDDLVGLLEVALRDPQQRRTALREFQAAILKTKLEGTTEEEEQILADLAYDLDFYQPDPEIRKGDYSLYGDERFETEVKAALHRLT